jgi:hypothetical protein
VKGNNKSKKRYKEDSMRYNYMGFNQVELLDRGLDIIDMLILKHVADEISLGINVHMENDIAYCIAPHSSIEEYIPILGLDSTAAYNRMETLIHKGILKKVEIQKSGITTYAYAPGRKYINIRYW